MDTKSVLLTVRVLIQYDANYTENPVDEFKHTCTCDVQTQVFDQTFNILGTEIISIKEE